MSRIQQERYIDSLERYIDKLRVELNRVENEVIALARENDRLRHGIRAAADFAYDFPESAAAAAVGASLNGLLL